MVWEWVFDLTVRACGGARRAGAEVVEHRRGVIRDGRGGKCFAGVRLGMLLRACRAFRSIAVEAREGDERRSICLDVVCRGREVIAGAGVTEGVYVALSAPS